MIPTSVFIGAVYHLSSAAHLRQGLPNGRRIRLAHQLADVLSLSPQGAAGFHPTGLEYRGAKLVLQRQREDVRLSQADQFLAELLQREILAFLRAFAGLCIGHRLKYPAAATENAGV